MNFQDIPKRLWEFGTNASTAGTNEDDMISSIGGGLSGNFMTSGGAGGGAVVGNGSETIEFTPDGEDSPNEYDPDLDSRYNPYIVRDHGGEGSVFNNSFHRSAVGGRSRYSDNEPQQQSRFSDNAGRIVTPQQQHSRHHRNMSSATGGAGAADDPSCVSSLYIEDDDRHNQLETDDDGDRIITDPSRGSHDTNPTVLFDSDDYMYDDMARFQDDVPYDDEVNYHLVDSAGDRPSHNASTTSSPSRNTRQYQQSSPSRSKNSPNNRGRGKDQRRRNYSTSHRTSTTTSNSNHRTRTSSKKASGSINLHDNPAGSNNNNRSSNTAQQRNLSLQELIHTLGGRSSAGHGGGGTGGCLGAYFGNLSHAAVDGAHNSNSNPSESDLSLLNPTLERRVRDFRFAQRKRREKYGVQKRWGVFGLYQHLADIRLDLEWAEDAAWRRNHMEPYLRWTDYENSRSKGMNNQPFFTWMTILICTAMLITTIGMNGWKLEPLNINPLLGPSAEVLIQAGARETTLIVIENQWYRLFSPLILHAGIIHWFINMLALYFIGGAIEQSHGFLAAAILFIVPAVGGNILSAIFLPQYISVGASGGIFGLIGACIADITINWNLLFIKTDEDDTSNRLKHAGALLWLFVDIIVNCLIGLTPFVDNFTHLGGLFYGVCCGLSTIDRVGFGFLGGFLLSSSASSSQDSKSMGMGGKWSKIRNDLLRFCGLIFSVCLIMVTTALLIDSNGESTPCPSCRYVSCVPFPFWMDSSNRWWNCDDCDFAVADLVKIDAQNIYYDRIDLTCPDGDISIIDITDDKEGDREIIRRQLPSYCRQYCDDVYISN